MAIKIAGNRVLDYDGSSGSNTNIAVGHLALTSTAGGLNNTAVGAQALWSNVTGNNNTAVGKAALYDLTTGSLNTILGWNTGLGITTGGKNTIIGANVTGLSSALSNTIILADGDGSQRLYILSTGNVGMGTTTPGAKLEVAGTVYSNTGNFIANRAGAGANTSGSGVELRIDGTTYAAVRQPAAETLAFYRGNGGTTETMRIDSTGNVGIGTVSPGNPLDVVSTSNIRAIRVGGALTDVGIRLDNTTAGGRGYTMFSSGTGSGIGVGSFGIYDETAALTRFSIKSDGNVGIGTITPDGKLAVVGGRSYFSAASEPYGVGARYISTGGTVYFGATNGTATPDAQISAAGGGVLMTLQHGGNVGIGDSGPSQKLTIGSGNVVIRGADNFASAGALLYLGDTNHGIRANPGLGVTLFTWGAANGVFLQQSTGNVGIGTASPGDKLTVDASGAGSGGLSAMYAGSTYSIRGVFQHTGSGTGILNAGGLQIAAQGANNSTAGAGDINFFTTGTNSAGNLIDATYLQRMKIKYDGNVGIGTASPGAKLHTLGLADAILLKVEQQKNDGGSTDMVLLRDDRGYAGINSGTSLHIQTWSTGNETGDIFLTERFTGSSAYPLRVKMDGTVIMNDGSVGIGTTTPGATTKLQVSSSTADFTGIASSLNGTGVNYGYQSSVSGAGGANTGYYANVTGASNNYGVRIVAPAAGANNYAIYADGTAQSYFAGNVGIGTTSPTARFEVANNTTSAEARISSTANVYSYLYLNTWALDRAQLRAEAANPGAGSGTGSGILSFWTAGNPTMTERMRIDGSGNVGIGTTSPNTRLQVNQDVSNTDGTGFDQGQLMLSDASLDTSGLILGYRYHSGVAEYARIQARNSGGATNIVMQAGGGNVGIGTASPSSNLEVYGSTPIVKITQNPGVAGNSLLNIQAAGAAGNTAGISLVTSFIYADTGSGATVNFGADRLTTNAKMVINTSSGLVGIGTVTPVYNLHVAGTSASPALSSASGIMAIRGSATGMLTIGQYGSGDYGMWLQTKDSSNSGAAYSIALNPLGGNVGIGTTSPVSILHIKKDASNALGPTLTIMNGSGGGASAEARIDMATYDPGANAPGFRLSVNDDGAYGATVNFQTKITGALANTMSSRLYINNAGNVGIGTTSPTQGRLQVTNIADATNAYFLIGANSGGSAEGVVINDDRGFAGVNSGKSLVVRTRNDGLNDTGAIASFETIGGSTINALWVGIAGNVGIGTTTPGTKLTVNGTVTATTFSDAAGNLRDVPQNAQSGAYTLLVGDAGKHISITTGGVTVPASVFSAGQAITVYNNSAANQTITQGASVTMYLAGTATTGNRTLAQRGVATILCVASNTFVISGGGLT